MHSTLPLLAKTDIPAPRRERLGTLQVNLCALHRTPSRAFLAFHFNVTGHP